MGLPKNDPALHTMAGIEAVIDEKGFAIEYGAVLLGVVYAPTRRDVDTGELLPSAGLALKPIARIVHVHSGDRLELWAQVEMDERDVIAFLRADAERSLKPGDRYEIRQKVPHNYGRSKGMAWYHNAPMAKREKWGERLTKPKFQPAMGFYLVGEYTVPTA